MKKSVLVQCQKLCNFSHVFYLATTKIKFQLKLIRHLLVMSRWIPKLSDQALESILSRNAKDPSAILQLLSLRKASELEVEPDQNSNLIRKYFLELSDGSRSYSKFLIEGDLCDLVDKSQLPCYSILEITGYQLDEIGGKKIVRLSDIECLLDGYSFANLIGNPKEITDR